MSLLKKKQASLVEGKSKIGDELDFASIEAYNLLKTNLSFSLPKKDKGYVIGVTSACPQEGKSYTTINLSYSLALDGNKVLLIDADMRRPSIEKTLEIESKEGLSNVLAGIDKNPILKGILNENLDVIAAGPIPPNPAKLIQSDAMKDLLEKASEAYDYVIVDLPPVTSVVDPIGVSKYLDGVMIIIKHSSSRRKDVKEAVRQLNFANANILGVIYNGYNVSGSGHYKKYGYYEYKSKGDNNK